MSRKEEEIWPCHTETWDFSAFAGFSPSSAILPPFPRIVQLPKLAREVRAPLSLSSVHVPQYPVLPPIAASSPDPQVSIDLGKGPQSHSDVSPAMMASRIAFVGRGGGLCWVLAEMRTGMPLQRTGQGVPRHWERGRPVLSICAPRIVTNVDVPARHSSSESKAVNTNTAATRNRAGHGHPWGNGTAGIRYDPVSRCWRARRRTAREERTEAPKKGNGRPFRAGRSSVTQYLFRSA